MTPDRRAFLRQATAAAVAGPLATAWGCDRSAPSSEADSDGPNGPGGVPRTLLRPALSAWSADAVHLHAPSSGRPLAYLSRGDRRVYVGRGQRDRAARLLAAYLSVSTGLWRIHLPGDDTRVPVLEGDEEREFTETDLSAWDPDRPPAEGDVRILGGRPETVTVEVGCSPVLGGGGWVSAADFSVQRLDGAAGHAAMETFGLVARGRRSPHRDCAEEGSEVRILSWSVGAGVGAG